MIHPFSGIIFGFLRPENIGFALCLKFFCQEMARIPPFLRQPFSISGHIGIGANVNIDFQVPDAISFSSLANLPRIYFMTIVNLTKSLHAILAATVISLCFNCCNY